MRKSTSNPVTNGSPLPTSTGSKDKTPPRDKTQKCKGQTTLGVKCEQYVGPTGSDGFCHFHKPLSEDEEARQKEEKEKKNSSALNQALAKQARRDSLNKGTPFWEVPVDDNHYQAI
jgi:hypothetical protein